MNKLDDDEKCGKSNERTKRTNYQNPSLCHFRGKKFSWPIRCSFYASQFLNMFTQAEKKGVTVIGIKNVMSAKEISEKFAETKWYQKNK